MNTKNQLSLTKRIVVIDDASGSLKKRRKCECYGHYGISINWTYEEGYYQKLYKCLFGNEIIVVTRINPLKIIYHQNNQRERAKK